jgi:hypothetical protein
MKNTTKALYVLVFVLLAFQVHAAAPTLSSITATQVHHDRERLDWTSSANSSWNAVYYGISAVTENVKWGQNNTTTPQVNLSSLATRTTYVYLVQSCNNIAECTNSSTYEFTTMCNPDSTTVALDCDTLEGLPESGTNIGNFLKNLAPGLGAFVLILSVFIGIVAIIGGVALLVSHLAKKGFK